jgi:hypothetical protein
VIIVVTYTFPTKESDMIDKTAFASWKTGRQMVQFTIEQDEFLIETQASGLCMDKIYAQACELGMGLTYNQIQKRLQFLRSYAVDRQVDSVNELMNCVPRVGLGTVWGGKSANELLR